MNKSFKKQSIPQLQKYIRETAKNTANIFLTRHSKERMKKRKVLLSEVYECIQQGIISLIPEEDIKTNQLICRMERYVCGRNLQVCVALDDDDPSLIVVTVF